MTSDRLINIFGALALGVADRIRAVTSDGLALGGEGTAALVMIGHEPGLSIDRLSRVLRLSHPGTVRLVDRLTDNKFAERRAAPYDQRAVALYLTEIGNAERKSLLDRRRQALVAMLDAVTPEDLTVLERISDAMLLRLPIDAESALTVCRFCNDQNCADCPMKSFSTIDGVAS